MPDLYIFNNKIESIFQLLGQKENDISYSVGYAFANCNSFLQNFLFHLKIDTPFDSNKIKIRLQEHEKNKGFTDFEIFQENEFHIIIEAKRGWTFPSIDQIEKYSTRNSFVNSNVKYKKIIVFNESISEFTKTHFNIEKINNIPIEVISWKNLEKIASQSISIGRNSDNRLLKDLCFYLNKISSMQKIDSNLVYIVSLGSGTPNNWKISWKDIVNRHSKYFHPVGGNKGGWPSEPPNYIAFRYNGKLQSIHHIDKYEVFNDPSTHFNTIPEGDWGPHYLYYLGPAIKPTNEVKSGKKIIRSMRVWAALDLLLTCETIQDARDETQKRK